MILSDTVKMKEFQEDPEMLLDLMYRIANLISFLTFGFLIFWLTGFWMIGRAHLQFRNEC